jgi:hypothetical protein
LAFTGDRVVDLFTVGGVGDDFTFDDVEVVVGLGIGDEEPLVGVGRLHLFDAEDGGLHRVTLGNGCIYIYSSVSIDSSTPILMDSMSQSTTRQFGVIARGGIG